MSARLRPGRRRLCVVGFAASLGFLAALPQAFEAPSATAGTMPLEAALPAQGATLTAPTAVLRGLVFKGVVTVSTTAGNVDTLQLTSTSATLTGLRLEVPCQPVGGGLGGMTYTAATAADSTSTAENLTFYARSVTATMAGATVTWTPTTQPPAEQLGDLALTDATVDLAVLDAPTLTMPQLRQTTSFCTAGRAALVSPQSAKVVSPSAAPSGTPDPAPSSSAEPTPSGTPDPTPSGAADPTPTDSPPVASTGSADSTPSGAADPTPGG